MNKLSLCMIIKNEEKVIGRCLESVKKLVDEIIIVDTGSTDLSKEICSKYTDKIYDYIWHDDFSAARNYSFSKASGDYILWLDADDVVPQSSLQELVFLKEKLFADTYMLKYDVSFLNNKPTFSFYRERILKNCPSAIWHGCVHECITPFGKIEKLDISIEHRKLSAGDPDRNYKIYKKISKERSLSPREQYYYGRELFDHKKYKECIRVLKKFIQSNNAWIENVIDSCYIMSNCFLFLNKEEKQLDYLFKTFKYSKPRPNICCKIGDYFLNKNNLLLSEYWYLLSLSYKDMTYNGGFVENKYKCYYPALQLSVVYFRLGNIAKAEYYNSVADNEFSTETTRNNKALFNQLKLQK